MWQKDKTNLTLTFISAQYELFKQLSQGTTPCDDGYTTVQNQLTMCNYKAETESVLQRDIFLFGLNDQTLISKIISEESPDVTATTIRQKLKKLEAGRATAKYIKGTNTIGKDPTVEGVKQVQNKATQKAKDKRGKAGIRTQISICKAIQQKCHLSQTPNKGSHTDKDKNSTNQNLMHPLIPTHANAVETQDTDQDSTVLHPGSSARNVRNMNISPASASQNHRAQM